VASDRKVTRIVPASPPALTAIPPLAAAAAKLTVRRLGGPTAHHRCCAPHIAPATPPEQRPRPGNRCGCLARLGSEHRRKGASFRNAPSPRPASESSASGCRDFSLSSPCLSLYTDAGFTLPKDYGHGQCRRRGRPVG
jgi:hypothetical protein